MKIHAVVFAGLLLVGLVSFERSAQAGPVVTTLPINQAVYAGGSANFNVAWDPSCNVTVQWMFNGVAIQDGPDITGAQTASLQLTNIQPAEEGEYEAVLTCETGTSVAGPVTLDVIVPPVITSQPQPTSVVEGRVATFTVGYTVPDDCRGLETITWYFGTTIVEDGESTTGATTATLQLANVASSQAGNYQAFIRCRVEDGGASITQPAKLTVTASTHIVFRSEPQKAMVNAGQSATLKASTNSPSGCGTPTLQWQLNGVNLTDGTGISGSKTGTLKLGNLSAATAGSYRAVATCPTGGAWAASLPATVVVNPTAAPTVQPVAIKAFKATAFSGGASTISWTLAAGTPTSLTLTPSRGTPVSVLGTTSSVVHPTASKIYTLTATNAGGSFSQNVAVVVGAYTTITACKSITAPGNYQVSTSLSSTSTTVACLDVHDTHDVFIHCTSTGSLTGASGWVDDAGDKTGGGVVFTNVHEFSLDGCKVQMPANAGTDVSTYSNVISSSMGVYSNDTLGVAALSVDQGMNFFRSNYVTFASNAMHNTFYAMHCAGLAFVSNTFTNSGAYSLGDLAPQFSSGIQAIANTIDGGSTGPGIGADDCIIAGDDTGDFYAYNTLTRVWDGAIEWAGVLRNSTILNNTITHVVLGIFGYYNGSLTGSMITGNKISAMTDISQLGGHPVGISLEHVCGLRPAGFDGDGNTPAETQAFYNHNLISSNVITNASYSSPSLFNMAPRETTNTCNSTETPLLGTQWVVGDNVMTNNDFGTGVPAPVFELPPVAGIATDGGGNKCTNPTPAGYPLVCH